MTATADRPGDVLATVPWPYVERRRSARTAAAALADHPAPDVPAQRSAPSTPAPVPPIEVARSRWTRYVVAGSVATDALASGASSATAYLLRFWHAGDADRYLLAAVLTPVVWVAAVALASGYESRWFGSGSEEMRSVLRAAAVAGGGAAVVSYALHAELARSFVLTTCLLGVLATLGGRLALRAGLRAARRRGRAMLDVVLVGNDQTVCELVLQVAREAGGGLRVLGACVPGGSSAYLDALGVRVLGDLHDASRVVREVAVHTVAVSACAEMSGPALRRLAWDLEGSGIDLVVAPGLVEVAGPRLHIRPLCGLPLLHVEEPELAGARRLVKACLDRVSALGALLVLSPLLLLTAVAVRLSSPGPVLFRQARVGKDGREFTMWKYRTMRMGADAQLAQVQSDNLHGDEVLFKLREDPRVTRVGRWLRRTSVDELPQLVNVLLGQMSLVGPRPPLPREVARYGDGVHRRLLVKPGLTGLWQIRGRSDLSWDESIRLDLRYVENWSLALDLMILWKTFAAVLGGRGAY